MDPAVLSDTIAILAGSTIELMALLFRKIFICMVKRGRMQNSELLWHVTNIIRCHSCQVIWILLVIESGISRISPAYEDVRTELVSNAMPQELAVLWTTNRGHTTIIYSWITMMICRWWWTRARSNLDKLSWL